MAKIEKDGALSEVRGWTNVKGRQIEGALLGVQDELAKFRMRNGGTYGYRLEDLSKKSVKDIRELTEESPKGRKKK